MSPALRAVHLAAVAAYLVSTLALLVVLARVRRTADAPARRRALVGWLRPYNVVSVGAVGVLIISGASALTDLKALYGPAYVRLLWPLTAKLTLTFALTMVATYLSFGVAHRLVRADQGGLPVEARQLDGMIARLRGAAWLGIALALWTSWVGRGLGSVPSSPAPAPSARATP
jgi:hypothetical protein